jgi:hypothetical protein
VSERQNAPGTPASAASYCASSSGNSNRGARPVPTMTPRPAIAVPLTTPLPTVAVALAVPRTAPRSGPRHAHWYCPHQQATLARGVQESLNPTRDLATGVRLLLEHNGCYDA